MQEWSTEQKLINSLFIILNIGIGQFQTIPKVRVPNNSAYPFWPPPTCMSGPYNKMIGQYFSPSLLIIPNLKQFPKFDSQMNDSLIEYSPD